MTAQGAVTTATLRDLAERAEARRRAEPPFVVVFATSTLVLITLLVDGRRPWLGAVALASVPVAAVLLQLLPWWRWPLWVLPLPLAVLASGVTAASLLAARGRDAGAALRAVCQVTAGVVALDLLLGGSLQVDALLGSGTPGGGRFAGLGNVMSAVLGAALLGAAAGANRPRRAVLVNGVGGLALLAAPSLGNDLGGVVSFAAALGVAWLCLGAGPVRRGRLLAVGAGAVALGAGVAWLDSLRTTPTHVGRFFDRLLAGEAGSTLARKADAALGSIWRSPWSVVTFFGVVLVLVLLRRGWLPADRVARALLAGLGTLAVTGALLNDSGVVVSGVVAVFLAAWVTVACPAVDR